MDIYIAATTLTPRRGRSVQLKQISKLWKCLFGYSSFRILHLPDTPKPMSTLDHHTHSKFLSAHKYSPTSHSLAASTLMSHVVLEVLRYVHRNRRFIRDGSPGRPPRLSHTAPELWMSHQLLCTGCSLGCAVGLQQWRGYNTDCTWGCPSNGLGTTQVVHGAVPTMAWVQHRLKLGLCYRSPAMASVQHLSLIHI